MPKINQEEYEILQFLNNTKDWIVRNPDGQLWAVEGEAPWKAPFYETWKENDGQDTTKVDVNSFLFQFIQWEDEEPYEIAELIEEYEGDQLILAFAKEGATLEIECECEETEVKDKKWLRDRYEQMETVKMTTKNSRGKRSTSYLKKKTVINLLNQLDEPEVLTQEWISDHIIFNEKEDAEYIYADKLQNLLVPKQFRDEFNSVLQTLPISRDELLSEFKSFVASGGIKLKQEEITEMNVNDLAYFIIQVENEGLIVIEKPTIPQFVADWIKEMKQEERPLYSVMSTLMNKTNHKWSVWKNANKNFSEIIAQAWLAYPNIEIEQEPKYYAKIKGWENVTTGSERFNWVYFKEKDTVGVSKAIENKYQAVSFTKDEWENLGINDDNADFVEVEELEE